MVVPLVLMFVTRLSPGRVRAVKPAPAACRRGEHETVLHCTLISTSPNQRGAITKIGVRSARVETLHPERAVGPWAQ
jgi:hypothetical protein